jgi:hypothetical protein
LGGGRRQIDRNPRSNGRATRWFRSGSSRVPYRIGVRFGSIRAFGRWGAMDTQSKREIWLLAIGTIMVEVPVATIAVLAILAR